MDLLDEIEELFRRLDAENSAVQPPTEFTRKRKRGRPITTLEWERPIRDMSPRQLGRNDLIETAYCWDAVVSKMRADSLNLGRAERSKSARLASTKNDRARRVDAIVLILNNPSNSAWANHPSSKLALRLGKKAEFLRVKSETLRKDIAKAKKK